MPLKFAKYWYALIVANFANTDHFGTIKFTVKWPAPRTKTFQGEFADGRSIVVFFYQDTPLDRVGNYLMKATMAGAGAAKSRFCAGC